MKIHTTNQCTTEYAVDMFYSSSNYVRSVVKYSYSVNRHGIVWVYDGDENIIYTRIVLIGTKHKDFFYGYIPNIFLPKPTRFVYKELYELEYKFSEILIKVANIIINERMTGE